MIAYKELRLGNLIRSGTRICKVEAISPTSVGTMPELDPSEEIEGILLDESWLRYFSGDESGNLVLSVLERSSTSSDIVILSTLECYLHERGFLRVCAYEYEKQYDGKADISDDVIIAGYEHIRYVHQLQNLYFSLSGKDLEASGDMPE